MGLLWSLFALTATITAFVLPVHVLQSNLLSRRFAFPEVVPLAGLLTTLYLLVVFLSTAYSSFFRTRLVVAELGVRSRAASILVTALMLLVLAVGVILFIA